MERHGGKIVFFGRFVSILRYTVAWLAGLSNMNWLRFLAWNAAGGIAWAAAVALIAYYLGHAVITEIELFGLYAAVAVVGIGAFGSVAIWRLRTRVESRL